MLDKVEAAQACVIDEFRKTHPRDRDAVLIMIALLWFGLLAGFIPDMLRNMIKGREYQLVTHLHAASSVGWMALLTWQALLIREAKPAAHRANGKRFGPILGIIVAVSAVATVWFADHARLSNPDFNLAVMAFQLGHVFPFAVLTAIGLANTDQPDLHKRMILLGIIGIVDAGWSRWIGLDIRELIGQGYAGQLLGRYPLSWALMTAIGMYDQITRGRLHPAFLPAVGFTLFTQVGAAFLFFASWWPSLAVRILGG
ncbi:MAG: hypothetical protein ACK51R_13815 [Hyphomonadaceae bacterium]|jgi:hypothetical protein